MTISSMFKSLIVAVLSIAIGLTASQAQIVKKTTKKAEQKAQNRVDNKIDNGIDKGLNAIEGLFKKKKKKKTVETQEEPTETVETVESTNTNSSVDMDGMTVETDYSDDAGDATPNRWQGRFTMETVEIKNGKEKDRSVMHMHFVTYKMAIITEDKKAENTIVIFDKTKRTITTKTNTDEGKTAIIMKMPKIKVTMDEEPSSASDADMAKMPKATGEYKMIQGYKCEKYVYEDDEISSVSWITTGVGLSMIDVANTMSASMGGKSIGTTSQGNIYAMESLVLEATTTDKKSGKTSQMFMKDVKKDGQDNTLFNLSGYRVMDMTKMQNMFKRDN
ncbi:MAG: hypothetical protein AB8F95_07030 [Bacteroidia bacterium]